MNIRYTVIALFVSTIATAQIQVKFSTFSGYESNINRAPLIFDNGDEILEKEDLHMNSLYQDAILSLKYSKKWKKDSFTIYVIPEMRYYYFESDASQLIFNSRLNFKHQLKKNTRWDSNLQYKIKDREGINLDQNELNLPFGYKLLNVNSGIRYRLFKNNRSYSRFVIGNKKFDNSSTRSVQYNFYGIETEFKNIKWKNHLLHSYGTELGFSRRHYDIINFSDNSSGDRTWNYLDASIFYRYPISKKIYLEPRISYQKREDKTNSVFGYSQIRPEMLFNYKSKRLLSKININYTNRDFSNLTADDEDGNSVGNLNYKYLRFRSTTEYKLKKKLNLLIDISVLDRKSNNTDIETTAFRSYTNNYYGIGLRYNF